MGRAGNGRKVCALDVAGVLAGTVLVGCGDDSDTGDGARGASAQGNAQEEGPQAVRSAYDRTAEEDTSKVRLRVQTSAQGGLGDRRRTGCRGPGRRRQRHGAHGAGAADRAACGRSGAVPEDAAGQAQGGKPWIMIDLGKVAAQQGAGSGP